jgi:signal peptidase I
MAGPTEQEPAASPVEANEHEPPSEDHPLPPIVGAPTKRSGTWQFFRELPILILIAFGLALLIKTFLVQAFYIPSASMEPTLLVGDRVLVNKLVYRVRNPHRGDIVVFVAEPDNTHRNWFQRFFSNLTEGLGARTAPEKDFIKRVIALPGETISMRNAVVTIQETDGSTLTLREPYISPNHDNNAFGPFTVPSNSYFLMGDNRANSSDSRVNTFGGLCAAPPCAVPKSRIVGRAFVKVWPPGRLGFLHIPKYQALGDLLRHPWEIAAIFA